jgi:hypothetical protein
VTPDRARALSEDLSSVERYSPVVKSWATPNGHGGVSISHPDGREFPFTDSYMLNANGWVHLPSGAWGFEFDGVTT